MRALPGPHAASDAIADVLTGSPRRAQVIHRSGPATYLRLDDGRIIATETDGGVGLPISMRVPVQPEVEVGATVAVGGQPPARWWPSQVPTIEPDPGRAGVLSDLLAALPAPSDPLEAVVAQRDPLADPAALVGLGPGLTPAGDDVLAGLLVTLHAIGRPAAAAEIATEIDPRRTTPISAALLAQAADGRCARPLLGLLRSLARAEATEDALAGLLSVGATSGRWLATGVLRALRRG